MCGRATVVNPDGITEKVYGYTSKFTPGDWKPRYNLNPREQIPAVYFDPFLKQRVLRPMHWNFIPSKLANRERVKEFDSQYSAFNARIETVASAPTFQEAWRSQRCLVVIDGIIEWVGTRRNKIPHLLRHPGGAPFAMAGLWNRWHDRSTNEEVWSCTVIVKDSDDWYARFHDRMAAGSVARSRSTLAARSLCVPQGWRTRVLPNLHAGQQSRLRRAGLPAASERRGAGCADSARKGE
jgi:putative SOS response-associated peptidase YedK